MAIIKYPCSTYREVALEALTSLTDDLFYIFQKLEGRVLAGKVNCNAFRNLCYQAGISSYPTVMLYHGVGRNYQGDEIPSQSAEHIIAHVEHVLMQYHNQQSHLPHDEF